MIGYGNSMFLATHGILARSGSTPAFTGLLDTYPGSAAAYSLRQLRTAYTGAAIRVRRSSDNAEQDFGFVNNVLDTASLLTFVGAGNGYITTWYDQSGNGNNAIMSIGVNQPEIIIGGTLFSVNSKTAIKFSLGLQYLFLNSSISVGASNFNSFVGKRALSSDILMGLSGGIGHQYFLGLFNDNKYYLNGKINFNQVSTATDTTTNQLLLTGQNNAGTMSIFKNSNTITSTQSSFTYSPILSAIGFYFNGSFVCNGFLQEMIFYNTDQSTNRTGIETNINSYYSIY
jgi:hypothetical protein